MENQPLYWRYQHTSMSLSAVALCAALVLWFWFLWKWALLKVAFFFLEGFGVCVKVVWNGRWGRLVCRFDVKDWVFLVNKFALKSDKYLKKGKKKNAKKQNTGNSFKRKGKMKKKASFHWFSYGTACVYRGILKILINVLKL